MLHKKLPFISSTLVFLYSATLLASGKSYSYIALTFCVIALLVLPITLKNKLPSEFYKISFALVCYFLVTALSLFIMGGKLSNLDMPSRTILLLPVFIFLLNYPPKKEWLFLGILIGAFISGGIALYHSEVLNIRAFSSFDYMVIQSGNMAMSLGILSLVIAIQHFKDEKKSYATLALIAASCGILASLLSGARGGWVIAPFVLIGLVIINRQLISLKVAVVLTVILLSVGLASHNMVEKRVQQVVNDIALHSEKNSNTSSGARIEMWKSGVYNFIQHPVFGTGYQNRHESKQRLVDDGLVDPIVLKYSRLHNNYIEELSIKGAIGLLTLMLFFGYPLYSFVVRGDIKNCVYSQLGVAHITLVMGYCATQNYINHHSGMLHYLMFSFIFYAMYYNQNTPSAKKDKVRQ